eukprot:5988434-Prymnesium_polylepis.1
MPPARRTRCSSTSSSSIRIEAMPRPPQLSLAAANTGHSPPRIQEGAVSPWPARRSQTITASPPPSPWRLTSAIDPVPWG